MGVYGVFRISGANLPEVTRSPHLRHELNKQLETSVCQDSGQETINGADEITRWHAGVVANGRVDAVLIGRNRRLVDSA